MLADLKAPGSGAKLEVEVEERALDTRLGHWPNFLPEKGDGSRRRGGHPQLCLEPDPSTGLQFLTQGFPGPSWGVSAGFWKLCSQALWTYIPRHGLACQPFLE